jgi:hypothetical protein
MSTTNIAVSIIIIRSLNQQSLGLQVFKVDNTLSLFVSFVDQWQVVIREIGKLWMIDIFESNIFKVVFKG